MRLLGVTISSDLSTDKHVSHSSSACFYWLRQIRRIRRSLDTESAKTLVHAFVSSRVDGCNAMLAGSSKASTDRLQRVLNAAARVVSGTHKFNLLHSELHWLDVHQRIQFKLGVTVHGVCGAMLLSTLSTAASSQPMRSVASGSAQKVAISSPYHDIIAPTSAVGRLLLQDRLPGTRCQTISVIRRLAKTLLGDY